MENTGWIKIHRKIWNNPLMRKSNNLTVWVWLLTHAQREDDKTAVIFKGKKIFLKKGQLTCGAQQISSETGISRLNSQRAIQRLKDEQQIEQLTDFRCSLITIKNWDQYQSIDSPMNSQRFAKDSPMNTKQEDKNIRNKEIKNLFDSGETSSPTPAELTKSFFLSVSNQDESYSALIMSLSSKYQKVPAAISQEISKFVNYWTEKTKSGRKEKWELQQTFEVQRRLDTWFRNADSRFQKKEEPKGIRIIS